MEREKQVTGKCFITQKNIILWSWAGFAVLLMAADPREGLITGEPAERVEAHPVRSSGGLPEQAAPGSSRSTPASLIPVAWHRDERRGADVVHRWLADYRTGLSPLQKRQLAKALYRESLAHGFDPSLVVALIATESSAFNWSRSHQGAVGLMQLLPMTAEAMVKQSPVGWLPVHGDVDWRGEETLYNPLINIKLGLRYLAYLHRQFGDLKIALTAYNYGPTRVAEWLDACEPLPLVYANRILALSEEFNQRALTEAT
ncbi:MAG: lytic transglycosylase domain-containing protein [Nitrospirota bacterium]